MKAKEFIHSVTFATQGPPTCLKNHLESEQKFKLRFGFIDIPRNGENIPCNQKEKPKNWCAKPLVFY